MYLVVLVSVYINTFFFVCLFYFEGWIYLTSIRVYVNEIMKWFFPVRMTGSTRLAAGKPRTRHHTTSNGGKRDEDLVISHICAHQEFWPFENPRTVTWNYEFILLWIHSIKKVRPVTPKDCLESSISHSHPLSGKELCKRRCSLVITIALAENLVQMDSKPN